MQAAPIGKSISHHHGLTTIELILTVGIIAILFAISTPVFRSFLLKNDLEVSFNVLNQDLYRAQSLARNGERDSDWGVIVQNGNITLYKGSAYANRDSAFDEIYTLPSTMQVIGTQEYIYQKFTGLPIATGATTLQYGGESHTSTINSKGMVEQQ